MRSFSLLAALSISCLALGVTGLTLEERPPIVEGASLHKRSLEKRHYGSFICRDQTYNDWCKTILNQAGTSTDTVGCAYENGRDQCYATCVAGYTRSSDGSSPLCTLQSQYRSDTSNCGGPGINCANNAGTGYVRGSATCSNGVCSVRCGSAYTVSNGVCVSTANDVNNCGSVGKVCPSPANGDATCINRACGITCDAGYQASGTTCVAACKDGTVYNPDNGACIRYTGCNTAADCIAQTGNSASYCYLSSTGNACFTPSSNSGGSPAGASCGYRSNAAGDDNGCATGLACINWVCTSPFSSDVNNCGSAGTMCPAVGNGVATSVCSNSACSFTCSTGYSKSADGKSCVATSSDVNNCGGIGTKCPTTGTGVSGAQCVSSSCQVTCGTGYAQSSDKKSCVATTNDVKNCGGLGTVCPTTGTGVTGAQCVSSSCQVTCGTGYSQSSDKKSCVATTNDVNNCGGLGQKCSTTGSGVSGAQCVNSSCQVTCGTGFAQSSDKKSCVATTNDVNNCGSVGTVCPATGSGVSGAQCVNSSCQVTCGNGFAQSSDKQSCVATTNDVNNCGGVGTVCPATGTGVSGAQCVNSACQVTCGTGFAQSSDKKSCIATTNDINNCGGIGTKCPTTGTGVSGAQCVSSSCQVTCGSGYAQSSDKKSCVATTSDVNNCGGVGQKCSTTGTGVSGAQCVNSSCQVTCSSGFAQSADKKSCVSTNDVKNCGGLGTVCPAVANGTPTCTNGSCDVTCNAGYSLSNGACTTNCKDGSYFSNGSCVRYTCSTTADCQSKIGTMATGCYNGQCYKPSSNTAGLPEGSKCGSAATGDDNSCAQNLVCFYGTCYNVFKTDMQNCGSYGNACPATGNGIATSTCSNGDCVVTCSNGYTLTDDGINSPSCVATSSDVNNCGGLNKKCPAVGDGVASSVCRSSTCVVTCSTGYTLSSDKQSCTSLCKDGAIPNGSGGCKRATCATNSDCVAATGIAGALCTYKTCYAPSSNSGGLPVGSRCGVGAETAPPGNDNTCVTGAICIDYVCKRAYNDILNCGTYQNNCAANAGPGYVANSATCTNGVCSVSCTSLYTAVNGVCVLKASAGPRQKKRAQKPITLCPTGETACPIAGAASFGAFSHSQDKAGAFAHSAGGYECLDTSSAVESCGGCASTGEGFDCTRIKHSSGVGCSSGQCVVLSCNKGYAVSANGSKCLKIHTGTARRHKGSSGLIH